MDSPARTLRREAERREVKGTKRPTLPVRGGRGGIQFIRDTYNELKKVVWPTRKQTMNLSTVVVITSLIVGLLLGAIDWIFTRLMQGYLMRGG